MSKMWKRERETVTKFLTIQQKKNQITYFFSLAYGFVFITNRSKSYV